MSPLQDPESRVVDASETMDAMWGDDTSFGDDNTPKSQWFRDEKYSMFIHWGLYSHLGGEWKGTTYYGIGEWIMHPAMAGISVDDYKAIAAEFNPSEFDATAIVQLAKKAGMRCIVITAKHHEGFAMYDSHASDFTITKSTPFARDAIRELADACHSAGIRFGFYYSQFQDWTEPDGGGSRCVPQSGVKPDFDRYFDGKVIPQVEELLTGYGPISVVWFDTPGSMGPAYSQRLVDLVHELQPGCLVNSRVGNGLGDYSTLGDMELPTKTPRDGLFECIDTTNDSWSYAHHDSHWKSASTIARSLVRTIARGCSFMLNVGPAPNGSIPENAIAALTGAGRWIQENREAIYGTTASPFPPFVWGDCTTRNSNLYLHVFDWPRHGRLRLASLGCRVNRAEVMTTGDMLTFDQDGDLLTLTLPQAVPESIITVIKLTLSGVPLATHQDLTVDGEHPAILPAEYATANNAEVRTVRWMETFGEWKKSENVTNWQSQGDSHATWHLNVLQTGTYSVTVEYACNAGSEGSEWQLRTGDCELCFSALDTGLSIEMPGGHNRMRYMAVEVGTLYFDKTGRQTVRLFPRIGSIKRDLWVKQVMLTPWK